MPMLIFLLLYFVYYIRNEFEFVNKPLKTWLYFIPYDQTGHQSLSRIFKNNSLTFGLFIIISTICIILEVSKGEII